MAEPRGTIDGAAIAREKAEREGMADAAFTVPEVTKVLVMDAEYETVGEYVRH